MLPGLKGRTRRAIAAKNELCWKIAIRLKMMKVIQSYVMMMTMHFNSARKNPSVLYAGLFFSSDSCILHGLHEGGLPYDLTCHQIINVVRSLCKSAINSEAYIQIPYDESSSLLYCTNPSVGMHLVCKFLQILTS